MKESQELRALSTVAEILTRTLAKNNRIFPILWLRDFGPLVLCLFSVMAKHPQPCEICERIAQIKRGENPTLVAELPSGYAVMGDSQFFRGYCLLLCKAPAADLEALEPEFRAQFLADMATLSAAVAAVVKPHKMNLESLGNAVPHLHWHVFPRQLDEAEPVKPVWFSMPQGEAAAEFAFDAARDGELMAQLREELARRGAETQSG